MFSQVTSTNLYYYFWQRKKLDLVHMRIISTCKHIKEIQTNHTLQMLLIIRPIHEML